MKTKYACVPLNTQALTKQGWKSKNDLSVNDYILSYDIQNDKLDWDKITKINFYEDAQTYQLDLPNQKIKVTCTLDHKWILQNPNELYPDNLIPTSEITNTMLIKTNPKIANDFNSNVSFVDKNNLVENLLQMDFTSISKFLISNVNFFTYKDPKHLQGKFIFLYDPNNQELYDAVELASYLLGYRIYINQSPNDNGKYLCSFIKSEAQYIDDLFSEEAENQDVWCPETNSKTWVMKQNGIITITGNSSS